MRTTVRLNESLLEEVKRLALRRHTPVTRLIEEGLRHILSHQRKTPLRLKTIRLKTVKRGGLRAGVNLDCNASLLDRMEGVD